MCGTSRWKAAKSASKTMKNLDETGIVVSCCRHQVAQKAVNMFRGEMYVTVDMFQLTYLMTFKHPIDMVTLIIFILMTLFKERQSICGRT